MSPSEHVTVRINLERIRSNVQAIRSLAHVPLLAVVKADAYGLGAARIVEAISNSVEGFCVFTLAEAIAAGIDGRSGKHCIALGPNPGVAADEFLAHGLRPAVWDVERAAALRRARPILAVDTGMQRFGCPPEQIDGVLAAGGCDEAFTHAARLDGVKRLLEVAGNPRLKLHAAGTSLLREPEARLDAVRPGLAIYEGAARVSARLVDVRRSRGPAGYSGFVTSHHGVILAGYSHGLRPGPCLINGRRSRLVEVGMQSAFVETVEGDHLGDEVVLLGDSLLESQIAAEWKTSPQEVLTRLCASGQREYANA